MPSEVEDPMYEILMAQAANVARIETGLVVDGTTGTGSQITLWGPTPNIVRLYDTPMRLIADNTLENWERIITLSPIADNEDGRVVQRNDRVLRYQVHFGVRLTQQEQEDDRVALFTANAAGNLRTESFLAKKAHRLIHDFAAVFADDLSLEASAGCHLVDHSSFSLSWVTDIEYPMSVHVADVMAQVSGY